VRDAFSTDRDLYDRHAVLDALDGEAKFGRTFWGLFSLELWQQRFHDRATDFQSLLTKETTP
jgi:asparagine synthase (glutamine-hydrolysing)